MRVERQEMDEGMRVEWVERWLLSSDGIVAKDSRDVGNMLTCQILSTNYFCNIINVI